MATRTDSSSVAAVDNEVFEFMETLNDETHETLVFRDQERRIDLAVQKTFFQTANKCLMKLKLQPMEVSDATGWDGIQASMDTACAALEKISTHDKNVKGVTGKMKTAFRSLCNKAGAGKAFTQLIPGDMFGSVLGGGLNFILTCMEQTGTHRDSVYKALDRLPRVIEASLGWTTLASQDTDVHQHMAILYTEICLTLDHILHWFVLNSLIAGAKRFLNPSAMNTKLQDRVAQVTLAANDLESKALQALWGKVNSIHDTQGLTHTETIKIEYQLGELAADIKEIKDIKRRLYRRASYEAIQSISQGGIERLLQDVSKRLYLENSQTKLLVSPSISTKDILAEFQYDQALVPQDIKALLRLSRPSNTISPIDANRAHAILWNPRIGVWLSDHAPYLYLLNGGSQEATDATTSFVMAKIAGTLLEQQQHHHHYHQNHQQPGSDSFGMKVIGLAYFCRQHRNYYRDAAASPSELAMSLLLQLIDRYPNFPSATLQDCLDRTDPQDISSICDSLRRLLEELPPTYWSAWWSMG
ncbi:hypothetical protein PG996_015190 [Apiospora saccharicola]|uniref:Fungal STAND N-terminal Goodbye domain-containing protein n=1 Tax=Apiospora saccharicola TaxID=335842 RepID=A0ABR1TKE9_9PEZI